jgi:hypothetical protein
MFSAKQNKRKVLACFKKQAVGKFIEYVPWAWSLEGWGRIREIKVKENLST